MTKKKTTTHTSMVFNLFANITKHKNEVKRKKNKKWKENTNNSTQYCGNTLKQTTIFLKMLIQIFCSLHRIYTLSNKYQSLSLIYANFYIDFGQFDPIEMQRFNWIYRQQHDIDTGYWFDQNVHEHKISFYRII